VETVLLPREKATLQTKKKIVEAAGTLMKQFDFRYITVKHICNEAGVAYGSFYHHFGTKENVIYEYCKGLFDQMLEANPVPEEVHEDDYIRNILWSLLVYAKFCELMGKDVIKYIFQNCPDDLFYGPHFERLVRDVIRRSYDHGFLDLGDHPERLPNIFDDVAVLYKGVVMCWFSNLSMESHRGRLCVGMEHTAHQMLSGFRNKNYHQMTGRSFRMVTDEENFDCRFHIIPALRTEA
jgi:AcrR family transcriptional regulator